MKTIKKNLTQRRRGAKAQKSFFAPLRLCVENFFCMLLALVIVACETSSHQKATKQWMADDGRLKVLSTTGMVGDLVKTIGGSHIDNLVLIGEDLNPHAYQLVKGDDEKFARADLIFYNGLNLEHGPSLQAALRNSPKAVALGNSIMEANPGLILHYDGQLDPHIWMDMSLWAKGVPFIVQALSQAMPLHAKEFVANGEQLKTEMLSAHQKVHDQLQKIPSHKRYLVTSHDAFNYFARAYLADQNESDEAWQKRFKAPEGLAPDSQLSAADIQGIIDYLDKYDIMVLFPESNVSKDSIRKIVSAGNEKGLVLTIATEPLYADAMGPPGSDGDTYLKMIEHDAKILASYLQGNGKEERETALNASR